MKDIKEAEKFLIEMIEYVGVGFHPDTDFNDYKLRGESLFSKNNANKYNYQIGKAFDLFEEEGKDIYEFCLNQL